MDRSCILGIVSDIHYAGATEQARGLDFELHQIANPSLRLLVKLYRNHVWLRDPLHKNHLVNRFLQHADSFDYVVANGDYTCDTAFVGVSDDASCESVRECTGRLQERFAERLRLTCGDHELGKTSMFGGKGGMRFASLRRVRDELKMPLLWRQDIGCYVLMGVTSSLIALPVFEGDTLPAEKPLWDNARAEHLDEIRAVFASLKSSQRVLLFCHDPTALPFLWREPEVRAYASQIEHTVIGHLHTNLLLWESRVLAGMPVIKFLGNTARRLSSSLNQARHWRPFNVRLCPALAGIQLAKGGGFLTAELDPSGRQPASFRFHRVLRTP